jgi:hypothetical protein
MIPSAWDEFGLGISMGSREGLELNYLISFRHISTHLKLGIESEDDELSSLWEMMPTLMFELKLKLKR